MDTNIKNINYRVRPPENREHGWIDRETLKVFNGKEWVAVGADAPSYAMEAVAIDTNFHKAYVSVKSKQTLAFTEPLKEGREMDILIHNESKLTPVAITLPDTDEYIHFKAEKVINIPVGKHALVKMESIGGKVCVDWELQA